MAAQTEDAGLDKFSDLPLTDVTMPDQGFAALAASQPMMAFLRVLPQWYSPV